MCEADHICDTFFAAKRGQPIAAAIYPSPLARTHGTLSVSKFVAVADLRCEEIDECVGDALAAGGDEGVTGRFVQKLYAKVSSPSGCVWDAAFWGLVRPSDRSAPDTMPRASHPAHPPRRRPMSSFLAVGLLWPGSRSLSRLLCSDELSVVPPPKGATQGPVWTLNPSFRAAHKAQTLSRL